jgi:folate-binding protein YgfZ
VPSRDDVSVDLARLALDDLHRRLGARFVDERGVAVPADYGDPAAELAALRDACAVVDLSWAGRLELRGRDRHRFLNGLVTSNVKDLGSGAGGHGLVLDKQGRVLADVYVTALDDRLWLELPASSADRVRAHLESFRVIDDVEVASLDDMALIGVLGPAAAEVLGAAAHGLDLDRTARVELEGCEVQLVRRRVFGIDGFVLWAPSSLADDLFAALEEASCAAGVAALDARRVELGWGRFGVDFDEETVANETGLVEQAIDFEKGCYLGQEIVARIFYKGKPSVPVLPLEVHGRAAAPAPPLAIQSRSANGGGKGDRAGTLTSVAPTAVPDVWLAIGSVARRALDDAAKLELEGGGDVRVRNPSRAPSATPS